MKKNWIRKILGGLSFTAAMFIFQACYGTPQDFKPDVLIEGQVKSKTNGLPIKGIKVSIADLNYHEYTNEEGRFSFYTEMINNMRILFEDVDSTQNGTYLNKDTILVNIEDENHLDIKLDEK
jgi:hypothetical protein